MKRSLILLFLMISFLILGIEVKVVYIDEFSGNAVIKPYEVPEGESAIEVLFERLSSPPKMYRSFIPEDIFRAAYFLEDTLVVDLKRKNLENLGFYEERMVLYQILISIFKTFSVSKVYLLVDGHSESALAKFVDISYAFSREDWQTWPVEVNQF